MKYLFIILILGLLFSCDIDKSNNNIPNEFKIQVINDIISNNNLLNDKNQLISNIDIFPKIESFNLPSSNPNFSYEVNSASYFLGERDLDFISQQINNNKDLELNELKRFGYNIFDVKEYRKNNINFDSIKKIAFKKNSQIGFPSSDFTIISKPIFNKEKDKVLLSIGNITGAATILFEKSDFQNKWVVIKEVENWTE